MYSWTAISVRLTEQYSTWFWLQESESKHTSLGGTHLVLQIVPHVGNCWGVVGLIVFVFDLMQHLWFCGIGNLQRNHLLRFLVCSPSKIKHFCFIQEKKDWSVTCSSKIPARSAQTISAASTRKTRHEYWKHTFPLDQFPFHIKSFPCFHKARLLGENIVFDKTKICQQVL